MAPTANSSTGRRVRGDPLPVGPAAHPLALRVPSPHRTEEETAPGRVDKRVGRSSVPRPRVAIRSRYPRFSRTPGARMILCPVCFRRDCPKATDRRRRCQSLQREPRKTHHWPTDQALEFLHGTDRCATCRGTGWVAVADPLYPEASIDVRCPTCVERTGRCVCLCHTTVQPGVVSCPRCGS